MYFCKKYNLHVVDCVVLQLGVQFSLILFVFCSGLSKEFIVKELRPGTQYKFRLVLALLHVF